MILDRQWDEVNSIHDTSPLPLYKQLLLLSVNEYQLTKIQRVV